MLAASEDDKKMLSVSGSLVFRWHVSVHCLLWAQFAADSLLFFISYVTSLWLLFLLQPLSVNLLSLERTAGAV